MTMMNERLVLLQLVLLGLSAAATSSCVFPEFSHTNGLGMSWLAKRAKHQPHRSHDSQEPWNWPKFGKVRSDATFGSANTTYSSYEEFLDWVHNGTSIKEHRMNFFLVPNTKPRIHSGDYSNIKKHGQTSVATVTLREGDSILEIPVDYCLSDKLSNEDPMTLKEAPWELRLATKLLRERSKGKVSFWAPFIKLLPSLITSPLFFSDLELDNVEDLSVTKEIKLIRNFVEASFQVLQEDETAGANYKEFAWALAVIYTSACRMDDRDQTSSLISQSSHLVIPFFSANYDSHAQVSIQYDGRLLKLHANREVAGGTILRLQTDAKVSSSAFIYRGFVPKSLSCDKTKVFEGLEDLVDWYFSAYGGINKNKYLTFKLAKQAVQVLDSTYMKLSAALLSESHRGLGPLKADYSVGYDGYIDPHIICILTALSDVNSSVMLDDRIYTSGFFLDLFSEGATVWEKKLHMIAKECLFINQSATSGCRETSHISEYAIRPVFASALSLLQKRLVSLLDSSSTVSLEDKVLLEAISWEGFSNDGGSRSCPACKWHTEELTFNDNLAVQLRYVRKALLITCLFKQSYNYRYERISLSDSMYELGDSERDAISVKKFLQWCEEQGSVFSKKIAVTNFHDGEDDGSSTSQSSHVRGTQALQDIMPGETICVLPLSMGLFDNESIGSCGADNWHLAAARLLQERALGVNSKWAAYIQILPQTMPTPINLGPHDIQEVQWWPMVRELIQVRKAIKKSYSLLSGPQLAWADFEDYRWAAIMVHSRAFTLPVKDDEEYACYVLMPFMDMINHHYHYQADWMSVPVREGRLEIIAKQPVVKGGQIFASFGPRSNDNLFLYYGFVLEDNPFDSAQIFTSFEEGVRWFTALWNSNCTADNPSLATEVFCNMHIWEQNWMQAKIAIDEYAAGISDQSTEWWEHVSRLAEYGYEYMQFQPGPSIYVGGVVDPSLLVATRTIANRVDYSSFITDDANRLHTDNSKYVTNSSLISFFKCMEVQEWPLLTTLQNLACWDHLVQVLAAKQKQTHALFVAKLAIALRCLEILKIFPTTIDEDKFLLEKGHTESDYSNLNPEIISSSAHLHLTRQYRYLKKRLLRGHIDSFLESSCL